MLFSEFPSDCDDYEGPHTFGCYKSLWLSVGCAPSGLSAPTHLPTEALDVLDEINLR